MPEPTSKDVCPHCGGVATRAPTAQHGELLGTVIAIAIRVLLMSLED